VGVNGGTLFLNTSANISTGAGNILTVTNNATLRTHSNRTNGIGNATHGVLLGSGGGNFDTTNASATLTFNGVVSQTGGSQNLTKSGAGILALGGNNTYTGNTVVNAGTFNLLNSGSLRFVIGATGVNNQINGGGTVGLNGTFRLDLTGAGAGGSWLLVDVGPLTETFDAGFSIVDLAGGETFTESANVWTSATYKFTEGTGILEAVPEPGAGLLLLGGLGGLLLSRGSRRRSRAL